MGDVVSDRAKWLNDIAGRQVDPPVMRSLADIAVWREFRDREMVQTSVDLPTTCEVHDNVLLWEYDDGFRLTAEIYAPKSKGPFPSLLFLHGGGWCSGSALAARRPAMLFAEQGFCVVNLDYRLAPEYRFPHAVFDVLLASRWIGSNIHKYGGGTPTVIVGSSAGANLGAAAIAAALSDDPRLKQVALRGATPEFGAAMFFYGVFDFRTLRPSQGTFDGGIEIMFNLGYLGDRFLTLHSDPLVSPILSPALLRFPPTYLSCGTQDTLLDQTLMMTQALSEAGVVTTLGAFPEAHHGFLRLDHVIPGVRRELSRAFEWLSTTIASSPGA